MSLRTLATAIGFSLFSCASLAQSNPGTVKIGVLTDMGGVYSDLAGRGSVEAVNLAVEDFDSTILGNPIEVIFADHQNKPDVGLAIARRWFDVENVDVIIDVPTSSVALGVAAYAAQERKAVIFSTGATERISEDLCSPTTVSWTWNNYAVTNGLVQSLIASGAKTWFIIAPDYAYGHTTSETVTTMVEAAGGQLVGSVFHPLNGEDFSSYLLQAQASKAEVIAIGSGGRDIQNLMKQANEFQIFADGSQKPAILINIITDTHSVGLETLKGIRSITPFYWDRNDETRAFAQRFSEKVGQVPGETHGGTYSAALNYLKAVEATGSKDPETVFAWLRDNEIEDMFAVNAKLLPNGQLIHDMFMVETKSPEESKYPWDYYTIVDVIPGEQAFRSLAESVCPLVNN